MKLTQFATFWKKEMKKGIETTVQCFNSKWIKKKESKGRTRNRTGVTGTREVKFLRIRCANRYTIQPLGCDDCLSMQP